MQEENPIKKSPIEKMLDILRLEEHHTILRGDKVILRPLTEYDWDIIWKWNYNPNTIYFCEGRSLIKSSPNQIQEVYRNISKDAFCFIIDVITKPASKLDEEERKPIGDCWLQEVTVERILVDHPVKRCRRIDLMIGDIEFSKPAFSVDVIRTLTKFGFEEENADIIFGCDIPDYNKLALKILHKAGYHTYDKIKQPPGSKAKYIYDVILSSEQY